MIRDKFNPNSTACTGGFAAAVFASMETIRQGEPGASRAARFLDGPDAGYCLDAPPVIPACSSFWCDFHGRPGSLFAVRGA